MKAAVLHEFKTPLSLEEVPRPALGADEVLIEVEVCGVCHSDLHVADGDWAQFAGIVKKPLILGHEIVGRVVERGAAVQTIQIGDRVGVPWVQWTCGECEFCREGNENLCAKQRITGVMVDGGYAEYAKAPASHVVKIPDALSSEQAAPLLCAGVTVHRALKQAKIRAGQRLAVFGVGGLGHIAVQIGCAAGAEVIAIDISEEKLALAKSLGAARTLNAATVNVVKELRAQRRRARCPRHLGSQVRIRHGVLLCAPLRNAAGGGLARHRHFVSAINDGRRQKSRSRLPP